MSFLPNSAIENIETEIKAKEYIDFLLDKNTMKFTTIGTQEESLKNWIEWAIKIDRYKYPIFPYNYGCEINNELRGKVKDNEETIDLIEFYIIDSLKVLQWIDEVEVRDIKIDGIKISCKIIVKTIYGENIEDEYNI